MQKLRRFFGDFDLFAALPTLRAKQQKESSSLFSGVISFILTLFFAYVFISSAVGIFMYNSIQSVQTESKLSGNQVKAKDIFFAIRVGYLTAAQSMKYFQIGYYIYMEDGTNITYKMHPCTQEQWKKIGDNYLSEFQEYEIGQFFCPNATEANLSLSKVYYAKNSSYIVAYIRPCIGYSYCQNPTIQAQYIRNVSDAQGAIFLLSYFLDPVIDPQKKDPISYTINTDVQLAFTTKRGIIATVQFSTFKIETDMSFWPVIQIVENQGNFVSSFRQTSIQLKNFDDNYALIYYQINRKYFLYQRVAGKLDEMLSYAGGLFSILISFLAIFLASFNIYRYQLMVAEGVFHENDEGSRIRQDDFTIWKYLKYVIFDWIQTLFCIRIGWKDCIQIDETREEANCHMDVTKLFRKIQSMESCLLHIVDSDQKDCLALVKPDSFGKIRRNRLILEYYEAIVQGKQALTIQSYIFSKRILNFGLWLARQANDDLSCGSTAKIQNQNINIQEEINQSIDFQSQFKNDILVKTLQHFKQQAEIAQKITLPEQLMLIQIDLAEEFFHLKYESRIKIQQRIPIIILQRLKKHVNFQTLIGPNIQPKNTQNRNQVACLKPKKQDITLQFKPKQEYSAFQFKQEQN